MEHETEVEMMNKKITDLRIERNALAAQSTTRGELLFQMTEVRDDLAVQLTSARARVKELEAENKFRLRQIDRLRAALTSAPAGGQERMEYRWMEYAWGKRYEINLMAGDGWTVCIAALSGDNGAMDILWQRPVASAADASEVEEVEE
jgi:hypothetical protein